IKSAAIYSDVDADALHVKLADEAHLIPSSDPFKAYLDMEKILEIAERSGSEAIHPGYGFLAENPDFVGMCADRGVVFIGPPSWCMYKAKPKHKARQLMKMINLPVVPGSDEAIEGASPGALNRAMEVADSIGYPVIVKPSGTGGGIGMMTARNAEQLKTAVKYAEERGRSAFGVSGYYIEKFLSGVKHVEFQVLADSRGNAVFLGERDCSIQRRFQKLVEEAPCPVLNPLQRMKMGVAAIDVAKAMRYVNAMTVEFLYVAETKEFYFNEVNARLQVEHCINELITGIDLVREQVKIAVGEELSFSQDNIRLRGHAIECRINAEDPFRNFAPNPGRISSLRLPHGLGVRIDEGVYEGYEVPFYYDSLLCKISTYGQDREQAIQRMKRALGETAIEGIKTNLPFQRTVIEDEQFHKGSYNTHFIDERKIMYKLEVPV
ncbi:MAG: biotin carboxylase N-terminal domain-containing protein, partial [Dehalococcoidia bacterium]|nr:biotin carboxylase N-terminal domain-containing protein [Dehalococcoidia bacterium]